MRTSIVILAGLVCLGCAPAGGGGIKYPKGWPLKALTVPAGAKQQLLPDLYGDKQLTRDGEQQGEGSQAERTVWQLAFSSSQTPEQIAKHVEAELQGEGFQRAMARTAPGKRYWWLTPDGKTQVQLEYLELNAIPLAGTKGWQGYRLGICRWAQPRPDISILGLEPIP